MTTSANPTLSPEMTFTEAEIDALVPKVDLPPLWIELAKLALTESYRQIAEAVQIPVGTVKSRLHRARKTLSKARGPLPVRP